MKIMTRFWGYLLVAGKRTFAPRTGVRFPLALPMILVVGMRAAEPPKLTEAQKQELQRSYQRAVILLVQAQNQDKLAAEANASYQKLMVDTAKAAGFPVGTKFQPDLTKEPVEVAVIPPPKEEPKENK